MVSAHLFDLSSQASGYFDLPAKPDTGPEYDHREPEDQNENSEASGDLHFVSFRIDS